MNSQTDQQLLRAYSRNRSETAFAELVRRHIDFVYSAARRLVRDDHLAEDVTQATFSALAQNAGHLGDRPILLGWLHRTTHNLAANTVRSEIRRRTRELEAAAMNETDFSENEACWEQIEPYLDAALTELSELDRDAVLLRFFERKSAKEMAERLNISDEAAQKRVSRAVERLRETLARRGVAVGASSLFAAMTANAVQAAPGGLSGALAAAITKAIPAGTAHPTAAAGGLKVLSFANAKTAVAVGVGLLLVLGAAVVHQSHQPGSDPGLRLPVGHGKPAISMGGSHGIILASDGSLWSWGTNYAGWPVLGLGKIQSQSTLRRIGDENDWVSVSSSFTHCLALKADGTMWAWGEDLYGQLGDGIPNRRNPQQTTPRPSAPGNDWKQVAAGGSHSLALKQDGTLWAWGNNWAGQLGVGSRAKEIHEISQVGDGTNWSRIWSAGVQSVGLQSDCSLWFWGSLTGSSEDTNRFYVPTRVSADTNWVEVGFGYFVVFGIKADGTLWAWGRNAGIYTGAPIKLLNSTPARIGTDTDWQACSSSEYFCHLLKKGDGSLWILDASDYASANKTNYRPIELRRVNLRKEIAAFGAASGGLTGVALTRDGEVWTWGRVLGEYKPASPMMRSLARSLGWTTDRFDGRPIVRDEPWLLPRAE